MNHQRFEIKMKKKKRRLFLLIKEKYESIQISLIIEREKKR